jgi:hypothetical protein
MVIKVLLEAPLIKKVDDSVLAEEVMLADKVVSMFVAWVIDWDGFTDDMKVVVGRGIVISLALCRIMPTDVERASARKGKHARVLMKSNPSTTTEAFMVGCRCKADICLIDTGAQITIIQPDS